MIDLEGKIYTTTCTLDNCYDLEICQDARLKFYGHEYNERDFKELRKMINERRGEMYILFNFYFVCPKTLKIDCQLAIGKKEATALTKAHKASVFADVDLDSLEIHTEKVMEFEKKKDLKKAVETIKDALG